MPAIALPNIPARLVLAPYQSADWILEQLRPGGRVVALTKGHLSMSDTAIAIARVTGPAHVRLSAWGIVLDDISLLRSAVDSGLILSVKLHSEHSFAKETAKIEAARRAFGPDAITLGATHAKIATVRNARWNVAFRGSANMERYMVFEQLDIENSAELCDFLDAYLQNPQRTGVFPKPALEPALAAEALSRLTPGGRVFGLTNGFSLLSIVLAALNVTGPASVDVLAWRVGSAQAEALTAHPNARAVRCFFSQGFRSQEIPEARKTAGILGADRFRVAHNHAKIVIIRNERWNLTIRSSMNLNANLRCEQFDIDADPAVTAGIADFFESTWTETPPGLDIRAAAMTNVLKHAMGGGMTDASRYDGIHRGWSETAAKGPLTLRRAPVAALPLRPAHLEALPLFAEAKSPPPRA